MKITVWALWLYAFLVIAAGLVSLIEHGSWFTLIIAVTSSAVLIGCGFILRQGRLVAGFVAGAMALLISLYFGYRVIATESLVPGGIMVIIGFLALFLLLVGMFTELKRISSEGG